MYQIRLFSPNSYYTGNFIKKKSISYYDIDNLKKRSYEYCKKFGYSFDIINDFGEIIFSFINEKNKKDWR